MNNNHAIIQQIDHELVQLRELEASLPKRIAALLTAKEALSLEVRLPMPSTGVTILNKPRQRGPAGALQQAIKEALKRHPKLTNAQLREAILAHGYPFSLKPGHVSKCLVKMFAAKEVVEVPHSNPRQYDLPRQKG